MPPSWEPLCKCMQLYCEPFFTAVSNWVSYEDEAIMLNRIQLVEAASFIFHIYSAKTENFEFDIVWENDTVPLLPAVPPSAGYEYKPGGDQQAYLAASKNQPKETFLKAGVFFQDNLLKAMAGWNVDLLSKSNLTTRKSIIAAVEKLMRLPEGAGVARFVHAQQDVDQPWLRPDLADFPPDGPAALSERGMGLYSFLVESKHKVDFQPSPEPKQMKKMKAKKVEEAEWQEDNDGVMWTTKHKDVGTKVAAYFPPLVKHTDLVPHSGHMDDPRKELGQVRSKLFKGEITHFARPSANSKMDQLYHVMWEDGDEQVGLYLVLYILYAYISCMY